jgi:hypothetical protein
LWTSAHQVAFRDDFDLIDDTMCGPLSLPKSGVRAGGSMPRVGRASFAQERLFFLDQVLAPVRFADALRRAIAAPETVLEVGPGAALTGSARRVPAADTDFFELGGESLLFIRMVNRVQRRYDVRLDMAALAAVATAEAVRAARARPAGRP